MFKNKFLYLNLILASLIILSVIYYYDKLPKFKSRAIYDKKRVVLDVSQSKLSSSNEDKAGLENNEKRD